MRNCRSFFKTRPNNTFAVIDALRVFSMCQVVWGHAYFYLLSTIQMANMEQFSPPHGVFSSFFFQLIPGCAFGVDSFFVMSGFLCANGFLKKVFPPAPADSNSRTNNSTAATKVGKIYPKFLLLRWLRLLPTELIVIMFAYNVVPFLGSGLIWTIQHSDGQGGTAQCSDGTGANAASCGGIDVLKNIFFVQNFTPSDNPMKMCFGHTWYLGVDMQLYLTVPLLCLG